MFMWWKMRKSMTCDFCGTERRKDYNMDRCCDRSELAAVRRKYELVRDKLLEYEWSDYNYSRTEGECCPECGVLERVGVHRDACIFATLKKRGWD